MKKLFFVIRTWNRAEKLKICLERLCEEIISVSAQKECLIFVIDNYSSDNTPKLLKSLKKKYPFLDTYRTDRWYKMGEPIVLPQEIQDNLDSYTFSWGLGDDDLILKGAFSIVWNFLDTEDAKNALIIHVGDANNTPHSYKIYKGTVFEFLNAMGFNQFIGWAPSCIWNRRLVKDFMENFKREEPEEFKKFEEKWILLFSQTAFPHVLRAIYLFLEEPAVVIDYPIASPMESTVSKDTAERWEKENVGWKYFLFVKVLKKMFDEGIIYKKLSPQFFKYLDNYLWNRFLTEMVAARTGVYTRNPRPDEGWDIILMIAELIDDIAVANLIKSSVFSAKSACDAFMKYKKILEKKHLPEDIKKEIQKEAEELKKKLFKVIENTSKPLFERGWGGKSFKGEVIR